MIESFLIELEKIHPFLKIVFEISLFSIIIFLAIIPISFLINVIDGAVTQPFLKIYSYFELVQNKLLKNIAEAKDKFKVFFSDLIKNNQLTSEDELITQKVDTQKIKDNLDQISAELSVIPGMVTKKDSKGEQSLNIYKNELDKLSKLNLSNLKLNIQPIKLDFLKEKKAKNAFGVFIIFFAVLFFLMAGNTILLNKVFVDALDMTGGEIYYGNFFGLLEKKISINIAIFICLLFTLVEAAVGFGLGYIIFKKDSFLDTKSETDSNKTTEKMLWWLYPFFLIVECGAYLYLSCHQLRIKLEYDTLKELFDSGQLIFIDYGQLLILPAIGFIIVSGLFIFGKFSALNYFKFKEPLESRNIKDEVDQQRNKVDEINSDIQSLTKNINDLASSIKNIQIQKIKNEPIAKTLKNLSINIKNLFDLTNKEIYRVKQNIKEFLGGKIKKKIPAETVKMQIFSNVKNIIIFVIGAVAIYYTFPKKIFIPGLESIDSNIILIIALLTPFLLSAIGNQLAIKKRLVLGEGDKEEIYDPNTLMAKLISYSTMLLIFTFHFFLHLKFSDSNFIGLILSLGSCFGFLYVGYNLLHTMPSIILVSYGLYSFIKISINAFLGVVSYLITKSLKVIKGLLEVGTFPSKKIIFYFKEKRI